MGSRFAFSGIGRLAVLLLLSFARGAAAADAPCSGAKDLRAAVECVKANEPAYAAASEGEREAAELKSSAYRLVNPDLELGFTDGSNRGSVEREKSASLLFTVELGGKRAARAKTREAEGLGLRADAFEQRIQALADLGGAVLRLDQLRAEKDVLDESIDAFRRVISLYRSRGTLPPEQKVSLHTFELVLLGYERKRIDVEASLLQYRKRSESLFGAQAKGAPFRIEDWRFDAAAYRNSFERWIEGTPEMLRARAASLQAEGQADQASADAWPDILVGPTFSQVTEGLSTYSLYGVRAVLPIPVLSWNGAERESRALTAAREKARLPWARGDARAKYESLLSKMERIRKLLQESPGRDDIQRKHVATEALYRRGMITGALMIEAHRGLVEYYEAKHALQSDYLQGFFTLQHLEKSARL